MQVANHYSEHHRSTSCTSVKQLPRTPKVSRCSVCNDGLFFYIIFLNCLLERKREKEKNWAAPNSVLSMLSDHFNILLPFPNSQELFTPKGWIWNYNKDYTDIHEKCEAPPECSVASLIWATDELYITLGGPGKLLEIGIYLSKAVTVWVSFTKYSDSSLWIEKFCTSQNEKWN